MSRYIIQAGCQRLEGIYSSSCAAIAAALDLVPAGTPISAKRVPA